jgi:uncharacterized protein YjcR
MENIYKRRRTTSEETIFEFLENSELNNITKNLNNLKFDNKNEELLLEILKKINKLENNFMNIEKNINKILLEKDYIIEELKDEIIALKNEIKDSKINNDNKYNYFY